MTQTNNPYSAIARRFKVSSVVAARRALDLDLISRERFSHSTVNITPKSGTRVNRPKEGAIFGIPKDGASVMALLLLSVGQSRKEGWHIKMPIHSLD